MTRELRPEERDLLAVVERRRELDALERVVRERWVNGLQPGDAVLLQGGLAATYVRTTPNALFPGAPDLREVVLQAEQGRVNIPIRDFRDHAKPLTDGDAAEVERCARLRRVQEAAARGTFGDEQLRQLELALGLAPPVPSGA